MYKSEEKHTKRSLTAPESFWEELDKAATSYNLTRSGFVRFLFNFTQRVIGTIDLEADQIEGTKEGGLKAK